MNQPTYDMREKIAYPIFTYLANKLDPVCKKTHWNFQPVQSDDVTVETTSGQRQVFGKVTGVGRVGSVFLQNRNRQDVTFVHGKFASLLTYEIIEQRWLGADENGNAAPLIFGPSSSMVREFVEGSFSILLLPQIQKSAKVATPKIKKGQLLRYEILATTPDAREGVAILLEKA